VASSGRPTSSLARERARERSARRSRRALRWAGVSLVLAVVFFAGLAVGKVLEDAGPKRDQNLVRTLLPTTLTPRETVTVTVSNP
jgi:hypothetical protein